ncbi:MAG: hypothetical protein U0R64_01395 [Candidatus Nanopelagicales bacterium]
MASRALTSVVAEWLPTLGASPDLAPQIADQVADQMRGLPGPLLLGVRGLQRGLSLLPPGSVPRLAGTPGAGEYVRLVRSLTTVVYLADEDTAS